LKTKMVTAIPTTKAAMPIISPTHHSIRKNSFYFTGKKCYSTSR
jgi:hypothetical protein